MPLAAHDLHKTFRSAHATHVALNGISLAANDGETLVVLGPSGAGKTTLLRILAGLEFADSGKVQLGDRDISNEPAQDRKIAIVFDRDALLPHLTIVENLRFAARRTNGIAQVASDFEIADHLQKKPAALSAGERQRAALARALLSNPHALLLDEPFAHLDPQLRAQLRRAFTAIGRAFAGPVIMVTHDHSEALLGQRLGILIEGRLVQCDTPQTVYDYPANVTVARFFGSPPMNLFDDGAQIVGIRPEHIRLDLNGSLRGTVRAVDSIGSDVLVSVSTEKGEITARAPTSFDGRIGDVIALTLPGDRVRRFDRINGILRA